VAATIAVIGTGNVGTALGSAFAGAGHTVVFGARSPGSDAARAAVAQAPGAVAVPIAEAAARAQLVVLALPWSAVPATIEQLGDLTGRVVIDATNPLKGDLSGLAVEPDSSAGEQVAAMLPGARVIKAFNTTGAANLASPGYPDGALAMLICGEDPEAKATVAELARSIGFEVVDAGGIALARRLEAFAMLWIGLAYGAGQGTDFGFRVVRR
jgi:8-hydroxy-5-deazaflavin:NADPH oxidoreductase